LVENFNVDRVAVEMVDNRPQFASVCVTRFIEACSLGTTMMTAQST